MTNITIRRARGNDAGQIAVLSEELGYPVEAEDIQQRVEELSRRPDHLILVAESSSAGVVGWAHAAEQNILEMGRYCEILGLVVAANQRGNGVGRRLVADVEQWALEHRLSHISVRSNVLRQESHPFYERMGFARVRTQHVYRRDVA